MLYIPFFLDKSLSIAISIFTKYISVELYNPLHLIALKLQSFPQTFDSFVGIFRSRQSTLIKYPESPGSQLW